MSNRYEMRLSGSGGQGVILASVIVADAAVRAGLQAVQSQSYGPEARGGMCKAETILSKGPIWFSKVICPNFLLALTQAAFQKYSAVLAKDAVILADDSLTIPEGVSPDRVVQVPILATARDRIGKAMTANIVAVGAINRLLGLFSEDVLEEAVLSRVPKGTEALNQKALEEGRALISEELAQKFRQSLS